MYDGNATFGYKLISINLFHDSGILILSLISSLKYSFFLKAVKTGKFFAFWNKSEI